MIDLEEIKRHWALWTPDDSTSLPTICKHVDALVAEAERLRAIIGDQQMLLDEHRMDNRHAYEEGGNSEHAADTERAAVLAYLRAAYSPNTIVPLPDFLAALLRMVEKGEHHREEEE